MLGRRRGVWRGISSDQFPGFAAKMFREKPSKSLGSEASPVITEAAHPSATANARRLPTRCGHCLVVIVRFH